MKTRYDLQQKAKDRKLKTKQNFKILSPFSSFNKNYK